MNTIPFAIAGPPPLIDPPLAGNLIDGVEGPHRIEIPNDLAGLGRIGAEMAVCRT